MSTTAARKLKRAIAQRALDSKVVVGDIAPEAAPGAATQPARKELRLPISAEQFSILLQAQARLSAAQGEVEMIMRTCLAQHHVLNGQVKEVRPGHPPKIVVDVPLTETPKGRGT